MQDKSGSESVGRSVIKLLPLTKRYDDDKHNDVYQLLSDVIHSAFNIKKNGKSDSTFAKVRDTTLSGGCVTGKSSMLCRLRDDPEFRYSCRRKRSSSSCCIKGKARFDISAGYGKQGVPSVRGRA